ncbi:MAG TPA: thioredoxin domain-containing protein, partial [Polyangiaceae bacterium]|nr:thioredoxin domain-containing protein [Polyangiaceae bacterium]
FAHGKTDDGHPWIGAEHPTLTLQEFVDYGCPHCKAASSRSLTRLAEHPNELRIVRRNFPLSFCQARTEKHCLPLRIALCADEQDRFWQADRWLFDHCEGGREPDVAEAARELGLDAQRLASCVTSDTTYDRAIAEWRQAKKLRIAGTPHYLKDDRTISAADASKLIDAL